MIVGGHMTPALAVVEELAKEDFINIVWVGHKHSQTGDKRPSAEYRVTKSKEIRFVHLSAGKLWRRWTFPTLLKGLKNIFLIPIGFIRATYILLKEKPDVIISFGGYLAIPLIVRPILLKVLRVKVYVHEQTIEPGLTSKLTSKFANRIFLTWEESKPYFNSWKSILTGNPISSDILKDIAPEPLFENKLPVLLVIGGNQGANTFNKRLQLPILEKYLRKMNIIHVTGSSTVTQDYETAVANHSRLKSSYQNRYKIFQYLYQFDLNNAYSQASLILSRSGVNTTLEILYKGIPAILMPLPWASRNEQMRNAQIASGTGLTRIYEFKKDLNPDELYKEISKSLNQIQQSKSFKDWSWDKAKKKARALVKTDAATMIVNNIIE